MEQRVMAETFSLVRGGPMYRLLAPLGLSPRKQVGVAFAVTWLPLAILTVIEGTMRTGLVQMPFVRDLVVHARLLLALPIYLIAARFIDEGVDVIVEELLSRNVVRDHDRYRALVRSAERLRDSAAAEAIILLLALSRAFWAVHSHHISSWITLDAHTTLTKAGWWYAAVALPILFFVSGRWLWRFLIWSHFLMRVSRMELHLVASHPDCAGGIGLISMWHSRFSFILFAASAAFAGSIANLIRIHGHKLPDYAEVITGIVLIQFILVVLPLLAFSRTLLAFSREGKRVYGRLGMEYVRDFEEKWLRARVTNEPFLGSPDIQSLADLANSYEVVSQMRLILLKRQDAIRLIVLAAAPYAPLLLTMMSVREVLKLIASVVR
jgi:hypothetical protein